MLFLRKRVKNCIAQWSVCRSVTVVYVWSMKSVYFVHLLVSRNGGEGLHGARLLANTLHLLINFMDADGSGNVLNVKSIEDELYKLYSELYPKE